MNPLHARIAMQMGSSPQYTFNIDSRTVTINILFRIANRHMFGLFFSISNFLIRLITSLAANISDRCLLLQNNRLRLYIERHINARPVQFVTMHWLVHWYARFLVSFSSMASALSLGLPPFGSHSTVRLCGVEWTYPALPYSQWIIQWSAGRGGDCRILHKIVSFWKAERGLAFTSVMSLPLESIYYEYPIHSISAHGLCSTHDAFISQYKLSVHTKYEQVSNIHGVHGVL